MHKITTNHGGLHNAVFDGDDFKENVPIVIHCESEDEARRIAAAVSEQFGMDHGSK